MILFQLAAPTDGVRSDVEFIQQYMVNDEKKLEITDWYLTKLHNNEKIIRR